MTELWTYLTESAGWAVLGFLGGYLLGRAARDVHQVATAITTEDITTEDPVPEPSPLAARRPRPAGHVVLGLVVALLSVLTITQGIITNNATRRIADCQALYGNAFADALDARATATAEAQTALDDLMRTISASLAAPATPPEAVRDAIGDYLNSRARAETQRQQHPYPPPPRDLCR